MSSHSRTFLPSYNFDEALKLPVEERLRLCIERTNEIHSRYNYAQLAPLPPIPPLGASEEEIELSEKRTGVVLPVEYAQFLRQCRYLDMYAGVTIWGFDYQGVSLGRSWLSLEHKPPYKYLVFGDYWKYADGDQLMFDLNTAGIPVVAYLHDSGPKGPLIEYFAPSFSLALWRLIDEQHE